MFYSTNAAEIDSLKNEKALMENSIKHIKDLHKKKILKLNDKINCQSVSIQQLNVENKTLSEHIKSLKNEITNLQHLVMYNQINL